MKVISFKQRSPIAPEDKKLILESMEEIKTQIMDDELVQFAYVGFSRDGSCVYGYCGADLEPYRLAGALQAQAQSLLHDYHVADQIEYE